MAAAEQHPFTPEPREPEPWPDRELTPWEWSEGSTPVTTSDPPSVEVLHRDDIRRVKAAERAQRKAWRKRGFSIGFGGYE
jgi:hypothetical protein